MCIAVTNKQTAVLFPAILYGRCKKLSTGIGDLHDLRIVYCQSTNSKMNTAQFHMYIQTMVTAYLPINYMLYPIGTTSESAGDQESVAKMKNQASGCRGGRYLPISSPSGIG